MPDMQTSIDALAASLARINLCLNPKKCVVLPVNTMFASAADTRQGHATRTIKKHANKTLLPNAKDCRISAHPTRPHCYSLTVQDGHAIIGALTLCVHTLQDTLTRHRMKTSA
jgi:hypothetical protein